MSVATDILYPALRLAGVITAAGRGPSVSQKADAFAALNRMVDSWFQQRLMIYTILLSRYTMVPSQTSYTIGPGGDFEAKWPVEIKSAAIILRGPTEVYMPLKLLTHAEWAAKSVRNIPTTVPTELYNDGAYPLSRLYLWGYPVGGNDIELSIWETVNQFPSQDADVSLVPAYLEAVIYQLAVRLAAQFGLAPRPDVMQLAREAKAVIKASNAQAPRIASADIGTQGRPKRDFNYGTGQ